LIVIGDQLPAFSKALDERITLSPLASRSGAGTEV
jgi:hypothetical protein